MNNSYKASRALNERGTFFGLKVEDCVLMGLVAIVISNICAHLELDIFALWINIGLLATLTRVRMSGRPKIIRDSLYYIFSFGKLKR